jgi:hypothetical protein
VDAIIELGQKIESHWQKYDFDLEVFPQIAQEFLAQPIATPSIKELANFVVSDSYPRPLDEKEAFGEPPVTVYRGEKFVIDIYFWFTINTSIHSHGFRGAFKVLQGPAIHHIYSVDHSDEDRNAPVVIKNDIKLITKVIKAGDVVPIPPSLEFIHEVGHCHHPQITLCVRTVDEPTLQHKLLLPNVLLVDQQTMHPKLQKTLSLIKAAHQMSDPAGENLYRQWLDQVNIPTLLTHYLHADLPWQELREQKLCEFDWGSTVIAAHKTQSDNRLNFQKLKTPSQRALALLLQRGVSPKSFVTELREHFGLTGSLGENLVALLSEIDRERLFSQRPNETAKTILLELVSGKSKGQIADEFTQEFDGLSLDQALSDIARTEQSLSKIPFFHAAIN